MRLLVSEDMERKKQPTVKDLAKRLGIAVSTVSRSLNDHSGISDKTRKKVLALAEKMGYVRNRSAMLMRQSRNTVIGLVVPDIRNNFYNTLASVLADQCRTLSFQVLLGITEDNPEFEKEQVQAMVEARVAGIVISPSPEPLEATQRLLLRIPTVQMLRHVPSISGDAVRMADAAGIRTATEHLLALGHRRIAYAGTLATISVGAERFRGFCEAHEAAGVALDESLVRLLPPRAEHAEIGVGELLALPDRPSALMMGSTKMSVGGVRAVAASGLVIPRDISVIAYGDSPWCALASPPLSTVRLPIEAMARVAVRKIFAAVNEETDRAASSESLEPEFIVRQSTALWKR